MCGLASIDRFVDAPPGFRPTDIVGNCKTVIVIAVRFPSSSLSANSLSPYTFVYNKLIAKIDSITFQIATELESLGSCAFAIPSVEPYDYWDGSRLHGQGILSLKHAAVKAGLGQMGKNTLLINEHLGNMLLLGAILLDKELEPDPLVNYQACISGCRICLEACPINALDGITAEQRKCRSISGKFTSGGGFVFGCNLCRKVCPHYNGIK